VNWNCSHVRHTVAHHQRVTEYKLCAVWTTANIFRPKALRTEYRGWGRIEWCYVYCYRGRQSIYGAEDTHAVPARPSVELGCRQGQWTVGMCRRETGWVFFVFGGQRYGDILVLCRGLHDQRALQREFVVGGQRYGDILKSSGGCLTERNCMAWNKCTLCINILFVPHRELCCIRKKHYLMMRKEGHMPCGQTAGLVAANLTVHTVCYHLSLKGQVAGWKYALKSNIHRKSYSCIPVVVQTCWQDAGLLYLHIYSFRTNKQSRSTSQNTTSIMNIYFI
jgi:hypothetical protein